MPNFRQEIFSEITGCHGKLHFGEKRFLEFRGTKDKISYIKEVAKDLREKDAKYTKNQTPYRYMYG